MGDWSGTKPSFRAVVRMAIKLGMAPGDAYVGGWGSIARRFGIVDEAGNPKSQHEIMAQMILRAGSMRSFNKKTKKAKRAKRARASRNAVSGDAFLSSYEWRRVRMVALKKYGPKCQCCGATPADGAVMNVDHIKPRKLFPSLALDVDNLQVLCGACNHGKGNWDMTDWREKLADALLPIE